MSSRTVTLWELIPNATELARRFSKIPPDRHPEKSDIIWVPRSQIEHVTSFPVEGYSDWKECGVTLPEWLLKKYEM